MKTAIVIGVGPDRGLGARLCKRLAADGLKVIVAGRTLSALQAVVVDIDEVLDLDDLPEELAQVDGEAASAAGTDGLHQLVGKPMSEIEALFIGETLKITGGNREEAATMLGIGERTLYRKIKEYGLS